MSFRLLIDECLTPELVQLAIDAGHAESTCVRDRGLLGEQDWDLMVFVTANDYTLVTHNARDFRGEGAAEPGGLHAEEPIHAGLICLSAAQPMDIDKQCELFNIVLEQLNTMDDLINQALEVYEDENGAVSVQIYDIPAEPLI
jgi:predicted nuclease of predicted toxin-antitoxin system